MRLGAGKQQSDKSMVGLPPDVEPNSLPIQKAMPVESISFYPFILPPQLITI